jgi:long-subunit acyl-CoA synthetase (AMP-forming)
MPSLTDLLRHSLSRRHTPILVEGRTDRITPAASLWTASRQWADWLSACGLVAGDRLGVIVPNGRCFVLLLLACLRTGVIFCPLPIGLDRQSLQERWQAIDGRLLVHALPDADLPDGLRLDLDDPQPPSNHPPLRTAERPVYPELAAILWSSGTNGRPRAIGLSQDNLSAQVTSHLPLLTLEDESRLVSYLSWAHCYGFGVELLPALISGAEIHGDPHRGRDIAALIDQALAVEPTHLFTVPQVADAVLATPEGVAAFRSLRGGVIGGAALTQRLSARLQDAGWPLRQGYGQTECAPGITLGDPGDFRAGLMGRPVGCDVRLSDEGELLVRGPNVHIACWAGPPARRTGDWLHTGDLAAISPEGDWLFLGRVDSCFKLANGRLVNPQPLEQAILDANPAVPAVIVAGAGEQHAIPLLRVSVVTAALPTLALPAALAAPVVLPAEVWQASEGPGGKINRASLIRAWEQSRRAAGAASRSVTGPLAADEPAR